MQQNISQTLKYTGGGIAQRVESGEEGDRGWVPGALGPRGQSWVVRSCGSYTTASCHRTHTTPDQQYMKHYCCRTSTKARSRNTRKPVRAPAVRGVTTRSEDHAILSLACPACSANTQRERSRDYSSRWPPYINLSKPVHTSKAGWRIKGTGRSHHDTTTPWATCAQQLQRRSTIHAMPNMYMR
jgi:hypothetical protein